MTKCFRVSSLMILAVLMSAVAVSGQVAPQPVPPPAGQNSSFAVPTYNPGPGATNYYSIQNQPFWAPNVANAPGHPEIAKLVKELGEAEGSAKKADITKQLESEVVKSFDQDMEQREADLTNLEERVKKLRAQLDRRRTAKDDIIQLQIKVLVNEAEGLGFGGQRFQSGQLPKASTRSSASPAGATQQRPGAR